MDSIAGLHKHTRPFYKGLYKSTELPSNLQHAHPPWFIIVHKQFRPHEPLGHWTAVYKTHTDLSHYDSLGDPPDAHTTSFLRTLSPQHQTNTRRHQAADSTVCGELTLNYVDFRARSAGHQEVCRLFNSRTQRQNEAACLLYVYGHMTTQ